ncbi:hypothetical protein BDZ90DRAFT_233428 [Jaminaea rosea]|uniref:Uncharacterized protein n=1 Tax=Jaminaea rosea TaxID=1569628 RepID=A0A316UT33_9BASI|nr:hypothetical protein BDZ90DRAFT_233428 [Jaminaea rosea]PWN26295.1 hypothetical protein BDZ90DRAFT_233428 [Jaminaea rosea]
MRPTSSSLIRIQPIPAPSSSSLSAVASRLPPPLRRKYAPPKSAAVEEDATGSASSSSQQQKQRQHQQQQYQSIGKMYADARQAAEAGRPAAKVVKGDWPKNLRVMGFVEKRERFWKVPKEQRDVLRKLLKEE